VTVASSLYFFFLLDTALVFLWGSKSIAHRYSERSGPVFRNMS
jgi:hypothetical protein